MEIVTNPNSTVNYVGDSANFICAATGMPPPEFEWFKTGEAEAIMEGDSITITYGTAAEVYTTTLTLLNLMPSDAGGYYCVASNRLTTGNISATSTVAELTLLCRL